MVSAADALRRAKWRESVGLEVPGSTPVKYFDSFGEFLDDQLQEVVSQDSSFPRRGNIPGPETKYVGKLAGFHCYTDPSVPTTAPWRLIDEQRLAPEVRAGFEKLRDELRAETPEWKGPNGWVTVKVK